jgi:hypothetical protein
VKNLKPSGVSRFCVAWKNWFLPARYIPASTMTGCTLWCLQQYIGETNTNAAKFVLSSDSTYSFHPMSLVWSMKLRCLGTEEKTWIKSVARDKMKDYKYKKKVKNPQASLINNKVSSVEKYSQMRR